MSQPPHKAGPPPASSSSPATPCTNYCPVWRFDLHLWDFDLSLPCNWGETRVHPCNLNVHSVVSDQSPVYAESRRLPFLCEDHWDYRGTPIVPSSSAPSFRRIPFPASRISWLYRESLSFFCRQDTIWTLFDGSWGASPFLDIVWSRLGIATQACLGHIVLRWYFLQVVGPTYTPIHIFWVRCPDRNSYSFQQFVPGNLDNPPVLIDKVDRLVASMEMFEKKETVEAENLIRRLLFFERFMCWLVQVGASVQYSKYYVRLLQRALLAFSLTSSETDHIEDLACLYSELLMRDECSKPGRIRVEMSAVLVPTSHMCHEFIGQLGHLIHLIDGIYSDLVLFSSWLLRSLIQSDPYDLDYI
ncbi:hypothetical protein DFH06DRAFT_1335504 [Mycena polygramma]|nr:hypothetical protein DFH06DRAFT_1335504 [Mycena polygramma]